MMYLVTIHDKMLQGEPDIGMAVVEAEEPYEALDTADPILDELARRGRCRCVASVRVIEVGKYYRTLALVKPPTVQVVTSEELP